MGEELKITQWAYLLIENGKSKLTVEKLEQIAALLDIEIHTLINLDEVLNNITFKML